MIIIKTSAGMEKKVNTKCSSFSEALIPSGFLTFVTFLLSSDELDQTSVKRASRATVTESTENEAMFLVPPGGDTDGKQAERRALCRHKTKTTGFIPLLTFTSVFADVT